MNNKDTSRFAEYKTKMKTSYAPLGSDLRSGKGGPSKGLAALSNPESSRRTLQNSLSNPSEYGIIAKTLYATNPLFESIITYYKTLSYYRYTVTPIKLDTKARKNNYAEIYQLMTSIVDGINIEIIFPYLIGELILNGAIYIYLTGDKNTNSVDTIMLPAKYCRPGQITKFGTWGIDFDMKFFSEKENSLNKSSQSGVIETIEDVLASLPKEFAAGYREYKNDNSKRWRPLDSRFAASFRLNDNLVATLAFLLNPINEYEKIKQNELTRSNNEIVNVLAHQIPNYEGKLVLEIDEINDIHEGMSSAFKNEAGFKFLTSFGETKILSLQKSNATESKTRDNAYRTIYNDSGIGAAVFNSETKESIEMTLARDESKIQLLINEFSLFYKIALNNIFNFENYQLEFDILSINRYNYSRRILELKTAASLGVGKLQFIVASGVKQSSIPSQIELEDFLKLDELKPLNVSYTQSKETDKGGRPEGSTESGESSNGI